MKNTTELQLMIILLDITLFGIRKMHDFIQSCDYEHESNCVTREAGQRKGNMMSVKEAVHTGRV